MKRIIILLMAVVFLIVFAPVTTMAQPVSAGDTGLIIGADSSGSEIGGILYIGNWLSINPSFSFMYANEDYTELKRERHAREVAMGLFFNARLSKQTSLFCGPKLGYRYETESITGDIEEYSKKTGSFVACVFGLHYRLNEKIGIMGSVEAQYSELTGDRTVDGMMYSKVLDDLTLYHFSTRQSLNVVFYF